MALPVQQLIGLQRAEFDKASWLHWMSLGVQASIAATAAAAVFINDRTATYALACFVLLLAMSWAGLEWQYRKSRSQAERARRATLIMNGLGEQVSQSELLDLFRTFNVPMEAGAEREDSSYYTSTAAFGDVRLAELLEESAFWSTDLTETSARLAWIAFSIYLICGLIFLFVSVPAAGGLVAQSSIRVLCALLTLLVSGDVVGAALAYGSSAAILRTLLPRLHASRSAGFPRADLLVILSDYNSAVESAPVYPPFVYRFRQDHLNRIWASNP